MSADTENPAFLALTVKTIAHFVSALGLFAPFSACAPAGPALEEFDDSESAWVELGPVLIESMSVERDGAEVRATGVFLHGEDRITLSMELFLEPPARFVSGNHSSRIAGEAFAGPVSSESLEFFGGQNEGPSVGGVFLFENPSDGARYRLRFPPTLRSR